MYQVFFQFVFLVYFLWFLLFLFPIFLEGLLQYHSGGEPLEVVSLEVVPFG